MNKYYNNIKQLATPIEKEDVVTVGHVHKQLWIEETRIVIDEPEHYELSNDSTGLVIVENGTLTDSSTQVELSKVQNKILPTDTHIYSIGEYVNLIYETAHEEIVSDTIYRRKDDSYSKEAVDDLIDNHKKNKIIHVTQEDKDRWDNNSGLGSSADKLHLELENCTANETYNIDLSDKDINLYNSITQLFKVEKGASATINILDFTNSSNFIVDPNNNLIFDSNGVTLNTTFTTTTSLNSDGLYETETIDKSKFKNFTLIGEV